MVPSFTFSFENNKISACLEAVGASFDARGRRANHARSREGRLSCVSLAFGACALLKTWLQSSLLGAATKEHGRHCK